jgi:hypothetical protein
LKCPPDIEPNMRMIAARTIAVAAAFSRHLQAHTPGERVCAAMPDPITSAKEGGTKQIGEQAVKGANLRLTE